MSQSAVLACLPRRGLVRACPGGCVHFTYRGITLDFTPTGFLAFTEALVELAPSPHARLVELDCFHATLRFSPEEFMEFAAMVDEGKRRLDRMDDRRGRDRGAAPRPGAFPVLTAEADFSLN